MRTSWLFATLLAGGLACAAGVADAQPADPPQPPEGWVEYIPKDKLFVAWIPKGGKRTERAETVPVKDQKIRVNILELETDGKVKYVARLFNLEYGPPPKGTIGKGPPPRPDPNAMIEAARDLFLKETSGKVADEKEVKIGERKAKEYSITVNARTSARMRVLVIGKLLYQAGIVGPKEQVEGKDADLFLDSFKPTLRNMK